MNSYFINSTNYYNEYKHPGVTDEYIEHQFQYSDTELDRLMFTNYEKYKTLMEKRYGEKRYRNSYLKSYKDNEK